MSRRTRIEDLPAPEKELTAEELKEVQGGFYCGGGFELEPRSYPGNEYVTMKYPSDGDDDYPEAI